MPKGEFAYCSNLQDRYWKKDMPDYDKVLNYENLLKSAHECGNGVRWKASVQMFEINKLRWCSNLKINLEKGIYKSKGFNEFYISERGKTRRIQSVHISERCVQKSLSNNVLKPLIEPKLIYDNSASLKGKGTDFAIRRLVCHLERHYRKYGTSGGILIVDFKNYFGSINHDILLDNVRKEIKDDNVFWFMKEFVDAFDVGLGLGSEISQISAVYFPNELDHFIKEHLHIEGYGRYMDDSYLISNDIEHLKYCLKELHTICDRLGITINDRRTQIIPLNKGFTILKKRFRIEPNGKVSVRLTRKNIARRRRKLKKQKILLDDGKVDIETVIQSYESWRGYAEKYDTHDTLLNMDSLFYELFRKELEQWLMKELDESWLSTKNLEKKRIKRLMKLAKRLSKNEKLLMRLSTIC